LLWQLPRLNFFLPSSFNGCALDLAQETKKFNRVLGLALAANKDGALGIVASDDAVNILYSLATATLELSWRQTNCKTAH